MRKVKRLWPAWAHGLMSGVSYAAFSRLTGAPIGSPREQWVVALVAGLLFGTAIGIGAVYTRRRQFRVLDGTVLNRAERVIVINMVRGAEHSDDWRLHQVATSIARRIVARSNGLLARVLLPAVATIVAVVCAVLITPRFWYVVAAVVVAAPFVVRENLRLRAAARAYLGIVDDRTTPQPRPEQTSDHAS
jgi:hypothetical protein